MEKIDHAIYIITQYFASRPECDLSANNKHRPVRMADIQAQLARLARLGNYFLLRSLVIADVFPNIDLRTRIHFSFSH